MDSYGGNLIKVLVMHRHWLSLYCKRFLLLFVNLVSLISQSGVFEAHCYDNWLRTGRSRVWSLATAKSLTPGFALINHFFEMIISVRVDCCSENLIRIISYILIFSHLSFGNRVTFSRKGTVVKWTLFSFTWFGIKRISS